MELDLYRVTRKWKAIKKTYKVSTIILIELILLLIYGAGVVSKGSVSYFLIRGSSLGRQSRERSSETGSVKKMLRMSGNFGRREPPWNGGSMRSAYSTEPQTEVRQRYSARR